METIKNKVLFITDSLTFIFAIFTSLLSFKLIRNYFLSFTHQQDKNYVFELKLNIHLKLEFSNKQILTLYLWAFKLC